MSHQVTTQCYDATKYSKDFIEADILEAVRAQMWEEGGGGLPYPIHWYTEICKDYDDAERFIRDHDHEYAQIAVRFHNTEEAPRTKRIQYLEKKQSVLNQVYQELDGKPYYRPDTVKAKFITCKACGSKLSVAHLKRNTCPLCGHDLRQTDSPAQGRICGAKRKNTGRTAEKKQERTALLVRQDRNPRLTKKHPPFGGCFLSHLQDFV